MPGVLLEWEGGLCEDLGYLKDASLLSPCLF